MEIIKQGDLSRLKKIKHFKCTACGCEFLASENEYLYEIFGLNKDFCVCNCPCCNRTVYVEA